MPAASSFHQSTAKSTFFVRFYYGFVIKLTRRTQMQLVEYPHVFLLNIRRRCCALSATARLLQLLQRCLSSPLRCQIFSVVLTSSLGTVQVSQQPVEMLDTQHAVEGGFETVLVSHQLVLDIQRSVDVELGTVQVSQQPVRC
ncbi:hypothetical protein EVAR_98262_1 [Eumeta japonica]|uniref:Uncharacterized protein n=1 Tax=Eumeta variegata TaxID=151549 RepID=A0A4C1ZZT1_EUMVA|nr:hypothetical protein EVAR_98262_1 [Eumeta japonica]